MWLRPDVILWSEAPVSSTSKRFRRTLLLRAVLGVKRVASVIDQLGSRSRPIPAYGRLPECVFSVGHPLAGRLASILCPLASGFEHDKPLFVALGLYIELTHTVATTTGRR